MLDVHVPLEDVVEELVVEVFQSAEVVLDLFGESFVVVFVDAAQLLVEVADVPGRYDEYQSFF